MDTTKRILVSAVLVFLIAICGGRAAAPAAKPEPEIYYPKLPPGITTIEEAKEDLARLLKNQLALRWVQMFRFANANDADNFRKKYHVREFTYGDTSGMKLFNSVEVDGLNLLEGGIDVPFHPVYFDALPDIRIMVRLTPSAEYYYINLSHDGETLYVPAGREDLAREIADDLYFIQKHIEAGELEVFKEKAAKYRASKIKPQVSEAQRKFIVQANAFTQKKDYAGAIDRYNKAIELDPVSYPEAYFNLALLSAQENRFKSAIGYMEKYLLLAPDAKDARSAQDKIYEWEAMTEN
jgi:tetratricopeptide (TPR) repeat protein